MTGTTINGLLRLVVRSFERLSEPEKAELRSKIYFQCVGKKYQEAKS